jgi:glycosyltransferase involved in cell wall biosynthesis
MSQAPRVLWITPWYPDAAHPYRAAYIQAQFRAAREQGADAQLLFVDVAEGSGLWNSRWETMEPGVFRWKIRSRAWKAIAHLPGWLAVWASRRAFRQLPALQTPQLLHGNIGFPGGVFTRILADRWGIPYVITEHWSKATAHLHRPFYQTSLRRAYLHAARVLPVSDHLAADLAAEGIEQTTVVPNVIDFGPFHHRAASSALPAMSDVEARTWQWLSVASLIPANAAIKRVEWILQALAWYRKNRPDLRIEWVHVGDGARLPHLQQMAQSEGVAEQITWAGSLSLEAIGHQMRKADLFLHPTTQETFGLVVREALATGLPVVTTQIPAHSGWWKPDYGVCTRVTEEAFLQGIQAMENQVHAVPEDAFDREAFTAEAVGKDLLGIYRSILLSKTH